MKLFFRVGGFCLSLLVLVIAWKVAQNVHRRFSLKVSARQEQTWRIIEGWTLEDEAHLLGAASSTGLTSTPFDPRWRMEFSFLRLLPLNRSLEGYLFPETYRVWDDELPEGLIRKQLQTFQQRVATSSLAFPAPLRSLDEVVTLASIVEKEVQQDTDRQIVAALFLRRLKEGMALQSDATLAYITGSSRNRATANELANPSLYNTYQHPGLPPGPICNPGSSAIDAVLHPTPSPYRYFLTDKQGKVLYAKTFEEHLKNKRRAGY